MNIAEILKDCPKGTELYSPVFGKLCFCEIDDDKKFPIVTMGKSDFRKFTKDGKYFNCGDDECVLFPSKENRDWSTFKVSQKECELMPFERVLVRDNDRQEWKCDIFSHLLKREDCAYRCIGGAWNQCICYAGNEHLLGTTNKPE